MKENSYFWSPKQLRIIYICACYAYKTTGFLLYKAVNQQTVCRKRFLCRQKTGTYIFSRMREKVVEALFDGSPIGMAHHEIILDKSKQPVDYRFLLINKAFEGLSGFSSDSITGRTAREMIPNIEQSAFGRIAFYGKIALEGGSASYDYFFKAQNKWYKVHVYSTEKYHFTTMISDITGHKPILEEPRVSKDMFAGRQKEQKPLNTRLRYDELVALVPVGVYVFWIRADGRMDFEYVSDRWCEIFQIRRKDVMVDAMLAINAIHPDEREDFIALNRKHAQHLKPFLWEGRALVGPNDIRWLRIESNPVTFNNGDIRWFGMTQDITKRKVVENDLIERKQELQNLVNTQTNYMLRTDMSGQHIYWNRKFEEEFSWLFPGESLYHSNSMDSICAYHHQRTIDTVEKCIANPGTIVKVELDKPCKSGGVRTTLWEFIALVDNDGNPTALQCIGIDITERRKMEEKLRELNAAKDKFFSIIAHDLRSPFNSIIGFSDFLMMKVREKNYDKIDEYADIISKSSRLAMDLLTNLLEWSQSQTGHMDFSPDNIDIVRVISDTLTLFEGSASQKSITIRKDIPANLMVFADKPMISTVVRNLVSNAIKYTGHGGEVTVSAINTPTEVLVKVKDNGVGIAPDRLEKLFRLDAGESTAGTNSEQGTGLGLTLCNDFVEKHGGKIQVESEVGKGSVFSFSLPA